MSPINQKVVKIYSLKKIKHILTISLWVLILMFGFKNAAAQIKNIKVKPFDKVIVSPHIQVNFIESDKEEVQIEAIEVAIEKLHIEVNGKTLHIYLDGAKTTTKNEKVHTDNYNGKRSIYQGTIVVATISYKNLDELSLRGEEKFLCESLIEKDKFNLKIYGESEVVFNQVKLNDMRTTIYGESTLDIKKGSIINQKFTAYGESEINTLKVDNEHTKITAYGEANLKLNVSKTLKVTAYGEANIEYKGNPNIDKGIVIGDATIRSIE